MPGLQLLGVAESDGRDVFQQVTEEDKVGRAVEVVHFRVGREEGCVTKIGVVVNREGRLRTGSVQLTQTQRIRLAVSIAPEFAALLDLVHWYAEGGTSATDIIHRLARAESCLSESLDDMETDSLAQDYLTTLIDGDGGSN